MIDLFLLESRTRLKKTERQPFSSRVRRLSTSHVHMPTRTGCAHFDSLSITCRSESRPVSLENDKVLGFGRTLARDALFACFDDLIHTR